MADRNFAVRAVDQNRLRVLDAAVAGRRIPHVTDGAHARQPVDRGFVEVVGDVAQGLVDLQPRAVGRGDADGLLAAVLQRVQPEVGQVGGFGVAVDAEDAAFFFESHLYRSSSICNDLLASVYAARPASQSARLVAQRASASRHRTIDRDAAIDRNRESPSRRSGRSARPARRQPALARAPPPCAPATRSPARVTPIRQTASPPGDRRRRPTPRPARRPPRRLRCRNSIPPA